MKIYISLPISGRDLKDVKADICKAILALMNDGNNGENTIITPLDICKDINAPYSKLMGDDIAEILECDAVYFMKGWNDSKGCNLEYAAAKIYNKKIMFE